ncbi:serine/threonine-protein phosphatase 2A regulatory subunit [Acrasis kona]|uniref:Serine/threonine-protein phosphatase 2A regulatory subunit n=1 Tax=Acrasis kona TaxID=1008807 RepID=A0AAW2Z1Z4_9EUKA
MSSKGSEEENEETLYPIAILIDELKNEDLQLRLNSIKRLSTISSALGPDRTRTELIPFLNESCIDDEDEVLLALAEELGNFVSAVGGAEKASCLLAPLETLCNVEEATVRDKAVKSLNKIATEMKAIQQTDQHFLPLVRRLSSGDWFTSRSSSCGLFAVVYPLCNNEIKAELRQTYGKLCTDSTPMVRRSAATHLGEFASKVEKEHVTTELINMFQHIRDDEQDSVRLLAIQNCVAFANILSAKESLQYVFPCIKSCSTDKSWRVRYMVAEHFRALCESMGPEVVRNELVGIYVKLTQDTEAEVRTAAGVKIAEVCSLIPKELLIKDVLAPIETLVYDKSEHVRAALASDIMGLAPALGKDDTIKYLVPLFLQLLKDEYPEVRLNIISKLDVVNQVIGVDLLAQSLLPAIVELAEDKQWRVRLAIIEYIPLLASQLGVRFFDDKLSNLCMTWLADSVFSIREAATNNLKKLTEIFGVDWARNNLLPRVMAMSNNSNYLYRMTTLFAISVLASVLNGELIAEKMLGVALNMSKDPVPNIRFNVAKTLQIIIPRVEPRIVQDQIRPCLTVLSQDDDPDVKYFAAQALHHVI